MKILLLFVQEFSISNKNCANVTKKYTQNAMSIHLQFLKHWLVQLGALESLLGYFLINYNLPTPLVQ